MTDTFGQKINRIDVEKAMMMLQTTPQVTDHGGHKGRGLYDSDNTTYSTIMF